MLFEFSCPFCLIPLDRSFYSDGSQRHVFLCVQCRKIFRYDVSENQLWIATFSTQMLSEIIARKLSMGSAEESDGGIFGVVERSLERRFA